MTMKKVLFLLTALASSLSILGQTTSVTSGDWSDPTIWSTAAVPGANVNVSNAHPITLNQNITIGTGDYFFGWNANATPTPVAIAANVTDAPGGTAYTLTMTTAGGVLDIKAGTTTFEGAASLDNSTLIVRSGATLILGPTTVNNGTTITVEAGGTLIVNGNFTNNNNGSGSFNIAGAVQINGNYSAPIGSVDISGGGTFDTTGTITTTGSSNVFGYTNDCTAGPCSGTTLQCSFTNTISPTSQVICSGSTAGVFTSTTNGGSPTRLWEVSTTSASTGYNPASGTNNAATYSSPAGLTQSAWYRVAVTSGGCTSRSAAVRVTVLGSGGWKGTTNNWATASNWCSGSVPTSTTDVDISSFPTGSGLFYPVIASGTNAQTKNLTIGTGASVTVSAGGTLSLAGNLTNNGTFTDNSNTANGISLVGTTQQTISGTTANTFNNLTINNTSGSVPAIVVNSNNVTVNNNLVLTSGTVDLTGFTITLGSAAASPGTLTYTTGTRFYNGNITRWFGTGATTVGSVTGHFPIGTSSDYRPFFVGHTGLTAGGTIKVSHTSTTGSSAAAFTDDVPIQVRSNSFWTVTTANALGTGTFAIRTEGTGVGTVGAVSDLRLTYASAKAAGSPGTNAGSNTNPQVNRTGINTATSGVSIAANYYWGSINATQTPLPVELISFSGRETMEGVELIWKTSFEYNFDQFIVERSSEGHLFTILNAVKSKGARNAETSYKYIDTQASEGRLYYRLKIVDLDGTFKYSDIIAVESETASPKISIYPNPVTGKILNLKLSQVDGFVVFRLINGLGHVVAEQVMNGSDAEVKLEESLPAGVYIGQFNGGSYIHRSKVLIK
jgi:hypothetical protein